MLRVWCVGTEAIAIPADQPVMQIKDLEDVVIPTMEIKVQASSNLLVRKS